MSTQPNRRDVLLQALSSGAFFLLPQIARAQGTALPRTATPSPFSFDLLKEMARALAAQPYAEPKIEDAAVLEQIDYDRHNQVKFRKENTLWKDQGDRSPVQPFFPGRYFRTPVRLFTVEGGMATEFPFSVDLFDIPEGNPARNLTHTKGFAGFRVIDPKTDNDWMAFLGASYWRTSGYSGQFGLSVRGLALDTAVASGGEEFPLFTSFWLEPGEGSDLVAYALLESPRATGAYRIASHHENGVIQDVQATVFLRGAVERLGIAPLTSMFWYGKHNRTAARDWRPEIHDSDGLEIHAANGERIWRPLNDPPRTMANAFSSPSVKGFGLMQRERDFAQYQDDGVYYDRRASAWVEPVGDWGEGSVNLVELRTDDEIHDNIVAMWQPGPAAVAGNAYDFAYKLSWLEDCPVPPIAARFIATRLGAGGNPGQPRPPNVIKVVCDFENRGLEGLTSKDGVTLNVTSSIGGVSNLAVYPVVGQSYWRGMVDIDFGSLKPEDDTPIDLRIYVSHGADAKSETMLLQLFPSQLRKLLASAA